MELNKIYSGFRLNRIERIDEINGTAYEMKHEKSGARLIYIDSLDKIIDMVELLEEVDTTGVPFTSNVNESINVMREDVATPGMDRKELMRNVPESENGYIKVPAIMDNGEAGA